MRPSAAICAACALVAPAAVGSSSGWQAVETAARGQYVIDAQLVTGAEGSVVAVWEGGDGNVRGSFRDATARRWSRPLLLARGPTRDRRVSGFALAGDRRNGAVLITSSARLTARFADLTQRRWSRARILGRDPIGSPVVVLDQAGNATAVWRRGRPRPALVAARGSLRTGRWKPPVVIADAAAREPQLVMDRTGGVIVLWASCVDQRRPTGCELAGPMETPSLHRYRLALRRRDARSGRWGRIVTVRTVSLLHLLGTAGQRTVLADADGGVTVVWIDDATEVVASTLSPGARSWSAPALLARPRDDCGFDLGPSWPVGGMLRGSTNAGGDALITWICPEFRGDQVGALTRTAGTSAWSPLALPEELGAALSFSTALADDRTAFLSAKVPAESEGERRLAGVHPPGVGVWSLTDLSFGDHRRAAEDHAFVVTESAGAALAVWTRKLPGSRDDALETVRYLPPAFQGPG